MPEQRRSQRALNAVLRRLKDSAGAAGYAGALLVRHAPLPSLFLLGQGLLTGLAAPLVVWAIAGLVNVLAATQAGGQADPWRAALPWLAALLAAFLLRSVAVDLADYCTRLARERLTPPLYRQLFQQAPRLPLASFEQPDTFSKLDAGRQALDGSVVYALHNVALFAGSVVGLLGLLALYARASWLLAIVLLLTAVVRAVPDAQESARFVAVNYRSSPLKRELGYWGGLLSGREPAAELRLFGVAGHLLARWRSVFDRFLADLRAARGRLALRALASTA